MTNTTEHLNRALGWRYAVKQFDAERKLTEQQLTEILEAARLTPTSYGLQLMKVVVVEQTALREQLMAHTYGQRQVVDASHLLVLCRESVLDAAQIDAYVQRIASVRDIAVASLSPYKQQMLSLLKLPQKAQEDWMARQVYIALGNLLTTCALLDIDSCPMEGFVAQEYDRLLELNQRGLSSVVLLPVGYRSAQDANATLKKVRLPEEEWVVRIA